MDKIIQLVMRQSMVIDSTAREDVMIRNFWNRQMKRASVTQTMLAKKIGVTQSVVSVVVNGAGILPFEKFTSACNALSCRPTDIYGQDALDFLYGSNVAMAQRSETKKASSAPSNRVRIDVDVWTKVLERAEEIGIQPATLLNSFVVRGLCECWGDVANANG